MSESDIRLREAINLALEDETVRRLLSQHIERAIRGSLGGERVYLSKPSRRRRDEEIYLAFVAGSSVGEIARGFEISESTVYAVIGSHRDSEIVP